MLFQGWSELRQIFWAGAVAYLVLVVFLRISGKRTLSKLNAFDLVVTVALGSTLASAFTQRSLSIAGATLSFALLVGFQYAITWLSVRSSRFNRLMKAQPTLLFYDGRFLDDALVRERVTRDEVLSAVRSQGIATMDEARAVVMESNAELVCLRKGIISMPVPARTARSTLPGSSAASGVRAHDQGARQS